MWMEKCGLVDAEKEHYTGILLITLCFSTCTMITEEVTMLTTPCYLTCTMITEECSLLTTPCYLTCTMITEEGSLLTTPCYLTCTIRTICCATMPPVLVGLPW